MTTFEEEHPEVFHYTNATGLAGIIQSQTLWATHYAYLNDSEEIRYFHKKQLPELLQEVAEKHLNERIKSNPKIQSDIRRKGGTKNIIKRFIKEALAKQENILFNHHLGEEPLAEPYITSFCTTKGTNDQVNKHGLLSQWRGYGQDGGYAIVFDTVRLSQLLSEVAGKWENGLDLFFGNVVYSLDPDSITPKEFADDLSVIRDFFSDHLKEIEEPKNLEYIYSALMKCACRYKHWGFKEENEVRIIVIPNNKKVCELVRKKGIIVPEIPRKYYLRPNTLVPFVDLFEDVTSAPEKLLPINRIIVGPTTNSQERSKKIRAVEILLEQHGINAHVSASEIPFTG